MNNMQTFLFYILIYFIAIAFMKIGITAKNKSNIGLYYFGIIISFATLVIVNVLRNSSVGADYINVGKMYTNIVNNGFSVSLKYNWFGTPLTLLCIIVGLIFGDSPFVFYLFVGFFTIFFLYKFLLESCEHPTLSLVIYIVFCLYLQTFNQSRQLLSVSILLYSLKFVRKKSFIKYASTVILASFIHQSAIIFLPLYFLKNYKVNKKLIMIYCMAFLFIFFAGGIGIVEKIIYHTKYAIYFTTKYNVSNVSTALLNTVIRCVLLIACLLFKDKIINKSNDKIEQYNYIYQIIFLCTILQILTIKYYFIGRLTTYFYSFYICLIPDILEIIIKKFSKNSRGIIGIILFSILFSYYYVYYNSPSGAKGSGYAQYSTIFKRNN